MVESNSASPPNYVPLNSNSNSNSNSNISASASPMAYSGNQRRKVPSPQELVSHYESQGLSSHDASIKVIEDLQNALFRVISSSTGKKDKLLVHTSKKIDAINNRLVILDLKLDTKPSYAQTFALGLASASVLNGIGTVMPYVFGSLTHIWSSVSNLTKHSS